MNEIYSPFHPTDQKLILTSGARGAKIWHVDRDKPVATFDHGRGVGHACFLRDGSVLAAEGPRNGATSATNVEGFHVVLWSADEKPIQRFSHPHGVLGLAVSHDGEHFATASFDGLRLWRFDGLQGPELHLRSDGVHITRAVAFSPSGETIAVTDRDGKAELYSTDGTLLRTIPDTRGGYLHSVEFTPDGRWLVFGHSDGSAADVPLLLELLEHDVYIQFDNMGRVGVPLDLTPRDDGVGFTLPLTALVADAIPKLIEAGYADRILLSQDVCTKVQLKAYGGTGYSYILETFLPHLRTRGVSEEHIHMMMVENPQHALTLTEPVA